MEENRQGKNDDGDINSVFLRLSTFFISEAPSLKADGRPPPLDRPAKMSIHKIPSSSFRSSSTWPTKGGKPTDSRVRANGPLTLLSSPCSPAWLRPNFRVKERTARDCVIIFSMEPNPASTFKSLEVEHFCTRRRRRTQFRVHLATQGHVGDDHEKADRTTECYFGERGAVMYQPAMPLPGRLKMLWAGKK